MIALTDEIRDILTIVSIITSTILAIVGIWISIYLYRKNSLRVWKRKLSKRLKFISEHSPNDMYTIFTKNVLGKIINEWKGFLLTTHAYWGYHRTASAYEYNLIIPFITFGGAPEDEGLYVWMSVDRNGCKNIKESDLENLYLIGKSGEHISDEILGSVDRVKIVYEWYRYKYKDAKDKKKKNKKQKHKNKEKPDNSEFKNN